MEMLKDSKIGKEKISQRDNLNSSKLPDSKTNVRNDWYSKERKSYPLSSKHEGHISISNTTIPPNYRFHNNTNGKTMQDYGNIKTQVVRSK